MIKCQWRRSHCTKNLQSRVLNFGVVKIKSSRQNFALLDSSHSLTQESSTKIDESSKSKKKVSIKLRSRIASICDEYIGNVARLPYHNSQNNFPPCQWTPIKTNFLNLFSIFPEITVDMIHDSVIHSGTVQSIR